MLAKFLGEVQDTGH